MCDPTVALVASIASAGATAYGAYQQSAAEKAAAKYNAAVAQNQAADARRRGEEEAIRRQRDARRLAGRQRTTFAANGIDISAGTAGDIVDETNFFGLVDATTARNNAAREAAGFTSEANLYRTQARSANPLAAAGVSLIGSAGAVADRWGKFRNNRVPTASGER